jgi:predicted transcriptional regulator
MEQAIEKLNTSDKKLLAMNVREAHTVDEVARQLGCTSRNVRRLLQDALDQLSRILLSVGLIEEMAWLLVGEKVVKRAKAGNSVQVVQTIAKIKIENVSVLPLRFDILNVRVEKQQSTRARCESRLFLFAGKR